MDFTPLRDYMKSLLDKGVPGLELAVCREHEVLFHECAGYSDARKTRAAAPEDRYWMYSCTKPVTMVAAMRGVEQGLFSLEDPVAKYLPAYRDVYLMENGQRRAPQTVMTLRHLVTMTGGLSYNLRRDSIRRAAAAQDGRTPTTRVAEALAEDPLDFEPGTRFQYSLCHDVMGAVIESASGMTLQEFMRENIFAPLGMDHTAFEDHPDRLAAQYTFDQASGQVRLIDGSNEYVLCPGYCSGGAGLVSCVEDYLRLADALACGGVGANGARVLKAESIDQMRAEQLTALHVEKTFSCNCGADYGYALGVRTRVSFNESPVGALGEFGWDGAAGADVLIDPKNRLSVFYAQHMLCWPYLVGSVHVQVRNILYPLLGL